LKGKEKIIRTTRMKNSRRREKKKKYKWYITFGLILKRFIPEKYKDRGGGGGRN